MGAAHTRAYNNIAQLYHPHVPSIEKTRIADITAELAGAAASRLGWHEGTADWHEVTRAPDIDLVDIVTPNSMHAEIAIDAANHGKHVFCEKPLADSVEAAQAMLAAVAEAEVVHRIGFVYRTWPAVVLAHDLIAAGDIGEVGQVNVRYRGDYGFRDPTGKAAGWRFDRAASGGGSLADIGSHAIDVARYLAGEITCVCANRQSFAGTDPLGPSSAKSGARRVPGTAVDDAFDVLVEFQSGASGVIQTNWCAAGKKNALEFEVFGDGGSLAFSWQHANELQYFSRADDLARQGSREVIIGPRHPGAAEFWPAQGLGLGYSDAFCIALGQFARAVVDASRSSPDFQDGLRACEAATAMEASAESGAWQAVDCQARDRQSEHRVWAGSTTTEGVRWPLSMT
jgi:predicted dehydrogenase